MMYLKILIMDISQENKLINLIKIEIIIFLIFSILGIAFYNYTPSHYYYNDSIFFENVDSFIALIGFVLKITFFWIIIFFPILWIIQLIALFRWKKIKPNYKKILVLAIVYLISVFVLFSLFSINSKQDFKKRKLGRIENVL